ncbi:hypothetical protein SUGI_0655860 [Cryptomeria japonica]|nr:hypothetical protein SUGI_0655860 [Cryptomeria japonica]
MVFYAHEIFRGENATVATVAEVNGVSSNLTAFGTVNVITHFVTEGPQPSSTLLGKFQGMEASTNISGANFHMNFSVVFDKEKYNGSSLTIHGTIRFAETHKELSVVGGTRSFKYAHGYAVVQVLQTSRASADYKFNVNFQLY